MTTSTIDRALPWLLRATWVAALVVGGSALDDAVATRSSAVETTAVWVGFAAWVAGAAAMAVPAVVSLTAARIIVPLSIPVAVAAIAAGASTAAGWAFLLIAGLAGVLVGSPNVGRAFVQASAYGEEDRHLLRPPAAYLMAAAVSWLVWAAMLLAAPLLLASERWVAGGILAIGAIVGGVAGWSRWHRLSRRWFVVVPIGVVIHDHLVLAETVMLRRPELSRLRLAPAGTEAADLTGPASGHAVEITTVEPTTVIFAATPKQPQGRAIHLRSALVAPSRPGSALAAAAARRLPVG